MSPSFPGFHLNRFFDKHIAIIPLSILFALRQAHNRPLAAPCPFPGARVTASTLKSSQLLIFSSGKINNDVGFAGS